MDPLDGHFGAEMEGYLCYQRTFRPLTDPALQNQFIVLCNEKIAQAVQSETITVGINLPIVTHEARIHQVEINSSAHSDFAHFTKEARFLRQILVETAYELGLVFISAGAFPMHLDEWVPITPDTRYTKKVAQLMNGRILALLKEFDPCATHLHLEVLDEDERVRLMSAFQEHLWFQLGLSLSAPIHNGDVTGYHSYRRQAWAAFPNTGIMKEKMRNRADWHEFVQSQVASGAAEDATTMWFDVRSCTKQPTVELRAMDALVHIEDLFPIMAHGITLRRFLLRQPELSIGNPHIAEKNLNAVAKNGRRAKISLYDEERQEYVEVPFKQAARQHLKMLENDARQALGGSTYAAFRHLYRMLNRVGLSTSILSRYHRELERSGEDSVKAERAVVQFLAKETACLRGCA